VDVGSQVSGTIRKYLVNRQIRLRHCWGFQLADFRPAPMRPRRPHSVRVSEGALGNVDREPDSASVEGRALLRRISRSRSESPGRHWAEPVRVRQKRCPDSGRRDPWKEGLGVGNHSRERIACLLSVFTDGSIVSFDYRGR
jgi:hypothetical protein